LLKVDFSGQVNNNFPDYSTVFQLSFGMAHSPLFSDFHPLPFLEAIRLPTSALSHPYFYGRLISRYQ
jgi:hypothetical protein